MKTMVKTIGLLVIGCGLLVIGAFFGEEIGEYRRSKAD